MYIDRIDLTLPAGDITALLASFTSARTQLEFLPSVSPSDRKHYAKLGLKNEALARQIIEVGRQNTDLIPRGIDFEKIDRDLVAREQLQALKLVLEALLGRISDSLLLTGVDIYAAALSMYHCLRRNADTTSLKETVNELKKGFARPSRKRKQVETATVPASASATETAAVLPAASATKPIVQVPSPKPPPSVPISPVSCLPRQRAEFSQETGSEWTARPRQPEDNAMGGGQRTEALTPALPAPRIRECAAGDLNEAGPQPSARR